MPNSQILCPDSKAEAGVSGFWSILWLSPPSQFILHGVWVQLCPPLHLQPPSKGVPAFSQVWGTSLTLNGVQCCLTVPSAPSLACTSQNCEPTRRSISLTCEEHVHYEHMPPSHVVPFQWNDHGMSLQPRWVLIKCMIFNTECMSFQRWHSRKLDHCQHLLYPLPSSLPSGSTSFNSSPSTPSPLSSPHYQIWG